jgi:hypothetical protein
MKTARYWTRAQAEFPGPDDEPLQIRARGWSDESLDAARIKALEIARRVAERIAGGFAKPERYPYGDRPLPEPVIREFSGAILTRNAYGALVLNTDQMMFVDVDRKAPPAKSGGLLSSLFGKSKPEPAPRQDPVIDELADTTSHHNLAARLYETAAGYRLIVTSGRFKAGSADAEALLAEYKSDPLYIRLCRMQESFRARLTPKPWRCGFGQPPIDYPFETARDQELARRWESEYGSRSAAFATCRFIRELGSGPVHADFKELIEFHDQETKALQMHPLA